MRTLLLSLFLILMSLGGKALTPVDDASVPSLALVVYEPDGQGIYHKATNLPINELDPTATCYAYNTKTKRLYLSTQYGNYAITLNEVKAKQVKKDKNIPHLTGVDLEERIKAVSNSLDVKFERMNADRRQFMADSIAAVMAAAKERERQAAIQQALVDSIHRVGIELYRSSHDWKWLPVPTGYVSCDYCESTLLLSDSIYALAIQGDKAYYFKAIDTKLGIPLVKLHATTVPQSWQHYEPYRYHLEAFADSVAPKTDINDEVVDQVNTGCVQKFFDALRKKAPYGFFLDWRWDDEYSMMTFSFSYLNTNKKTIKYIDVYWKVYNDVDDVRGSGHFKGTGPVEQYNSGTWNWDSSSYIVAGDATRMELTKVIITYMNGSQQTLTKKMIFNEADYHDN